MELRVGFPFYSEFQAGDTSYGSLGAPVFGLEFNLAGSALTAEVFFSGGFHTVGRSDSALLFAHKDRGVSVRFSTGIGITFLQLISVNYQLLVVNGDDFIDTSVASAGLYATGAWNIDFRIVDLVRNLTAFFTTQES